MSLDPRQFLSSALTAGLVVVQAACDDAGDDPVVARVGAVDIPASRLAGFVERLPEGLRSPHEGVAAVREHLRSVVDEELLLAEAAARGIDDEPGVRREVEAKARSHLSQAWLNRQLTDGVTVSPEEVERAFHDRGYDRERLLATVLVPTRDAALQAAEQLRAGASFAEAAARFAPAGRQLEPVWVGIADLARFGIPESVFHSLDPGRVAEPVEAGGGWLVYAFRETREAELADVGQELHDRLLRERWQQRIRREQETLEQRFGLRLDAGGLASLLSGQPEEEAPLYRFADVTLTVGDFLHGLRAYGYSTQLEDSSEVAELAERIVLPERLRAAAARDRGWDEEPAFVDYFDRERNEVVLKALARDEVERRGGVSAAEARDFHEANPERFRRPEEVVIRRLYVHSEALARDLRRQLEEGVPIEELLELPEVSHHVAPGTRGRTRLFPIHRSRFPELVDAAFAAETGDLAGPVPMADGWVVFRVLDKHPGRLQPFEAVRRRAMALLRQERQTAAMRDLIRRLRETRKAEIELFPERYAAAGDP